MECCPTLTKPLLRLGVPAFQLPPVKENPGLSPSLLADLTKSQDYVTMGTITENYERITLNRV